MSNGANVIRKTPLVVGAMLLAGNASAVDFSMCDGFAAFAESVMKQRRVGTSKETTIAVLQRGFPAGKPELQATLVQIIEGAYSFPQTIDPVEFREMHRNICVDAFKQ